MDTVFSQNVLGYCSREDPNAESLCNSQVTCHNNVDICLQEGYIEQGYCPREPCARLPSTYINHYCANGGVVVPQFGGKAAEADKRALEIIQHAYGSEYKVKPGTGK